jgi:signal transduction histidine kinase
MVLHMAGQRSGDRNPVLYLLLATVGVVAAFFASILYWLDVGAKISADALDAATNAALSVKHLSLARGEGTHLRSEAHAAVDAQARGMRVDTQPLTHSLGVHDAEISAYAALRTFPGEHAIQAETLKMARSFNSAVSQLVSRLDDGDRAGAKRALEGSVLPLTEQLDMELQRLILFNAEQQYWWAHTLDEQRRHAGRVLYVFNGVSLGLGLLLLVLAVRVTRIQWRLVEARERVAQERAQESAHFSERLERLSSASVRVWQATAATTELMPMLQSAIEQARELTGADFAAVGIGGDDDHPFDPWVFSGMGSAEEKAIGRTPRPVGVLGVVARRREALRIPDVNKAPETRGLPPRHPAVGPFLGMPILEGDTLVGQLYLARRPGREPFDEPDERIVRLLANLVATAVGHVTLNREVQTAIQQREEMISFISHDLRSPLSAIALSAERIQRLSAGSEGGDDFGDLGQRVARTADRMRRLIDNLVDLSRVESRALRVKPTQQAVEPMVAEAIEMRTPLSRKKSIELRAAVEPVPAVFCESELIVRVLWNLISNAIKFTEPGGTITVSARPVESNVYFVVQDTGMGIAEEDLPHIFDRFWQSERSRRGAGLGLYISKGIVEAHGGQIGAKSQRNVGTSIWFTLLSQPPLTTQLHA